ncbi:hypothetical protein Q5752_003739 [Cryptotrichosporon argae]
MSKTEVLIVGTGIFGMSTALWMLESGRYSVTVLDKCNVLPAPDAASTDINKIIRAGDYADPLFAQLCFDAVELWRKPEWQGTYHESGVICLANDDGAKGHDFVTRAYANCLAAGIDVSLLPTPAAIRARLPAGPRAGPLDGQQGYHNPVGGWAEAGRAVEVGLARVRALGGRVLSGKEVVRLLKDGKRVTGVATRDGNEFRADLVLVAAGAWTPALFASPEIQLRLPEVVATGQSVMTVQLSADEAERYADIPVIFNLETGFYVFPPNPDGTVKCAIHAAGYTYTPANAAAVAAVSVPRTKLTPGAEDGAIPCEMFARLREGLRATWPELADKEVTMTRMCWYCDTVTGDFLVDYHPDYDNLVIATGGSGHAFKFAPVIGREVLAIVERRPSPLGERFSFAPKIALGADVRIGERRPLDLDALVSRQDLQAAGVAA